MKRLMPLWLSLVVLAGAVMVRVQDPTIAVTLRHAVFDAFQRWHPRTYEPMPVRILDIDEESLAHLGQWALAAGPSRPRRGSPGQDGSGGRGL